jgi:hypothetical protein
VPPFPGNGHASGTIGSPCRLRIVVLAQCRVRPQSIAVEAQIQPRVGVLRQLAERFQFRESQQRRVSFQRLTNGTRTDAQWASYQQNKTHGLRRTNADKENVIKRALRHPKGIEMSDSQLAKVLGVTDKTVAKYRSELESTSEIPKLEKTTGKDGKARKRRKSPPKPHKPDWCCVCGKYTVAQGKTRCSKCASENPPVPSTAPVDVEPCSVCKTWIRVDGDRCQKGIDADRREDDDDGELIGVMDDDGRFQFQDDLVAEQEGQRPKSRDRGVELSHDAINALKRIPANDALKRRAYEIVRDYCDARIKEMA